MWNSRDRAIALAQPWHQRNANWFPVAISLLFSVIFIARSAFLVGTTVYFSLFDDAMISMQYARNLASGAGLVWFPGEVPVEGYTNFLWTLWMAGLHRLPIAEAQLPLLVMLSSAALLAVNVRLVGLAAAALVGDTAKLPLLAMWATALYYPLYYWSLRGMEVGLIATLIAAMIVLAARIMARRERRAVVALALVVALAILTRTDAIVPAALTVAFVISGVRAQDRRVVAFLLGGALVGTLLAHTLGRLLYYGQPLPNTYYLKMTGVPIVTRVGHGIEVFVDLCKKHLGLPLLCGLPLLIRPRAIPRIGWLIGAIVLGQCAYSVYVGGDAWEWMGYANRYIAPVMPLVLISALYGGRVLLARIPARPHLRHWALGGFALLLIFGISGTDVARSWRDGAYHQEEDAIMARYGLLLRDTTPSEATLAVAWAGAPTYYSHRRTIDLLGKSDRVIAMEPGRAIPFRPGHNKWDYTYSIAARRPDVIAHVDSVTAQDLALFARWGYTAIAPAVFVRADAADIDRARLADGIAATPRLSVQPHIIIVQQP